MDEKTEVTKKSRKKIGDKKCEWKRKKFENVDIVKIPVIKS